MKKPAAYCRVALTTALISSGVILTGCINNQVGWIEDGDTLKGTMGGVYAVTKADGVDLHSMKVSHGLKTGEMETGKIPVKDGPLPISINASSGSTADITGAFGMINNFFSICTLGIWPFVKTENCMCNVTVKTPQGEVSKPYVLGMRRWSSFILPIAALPCPGWGDWRSSPSMSGSGHMPTDFKNQMAAEVLSGILTEEFNRTEMNKYVEAIQRQHAAQAEKERQWMEKKRKVAQKLQAIIDGE